jgi:AcrR family transcriptional regulator
MSRKPAHLQIDTLKTLRTVSFELFGRHGYDGVSIGDIAAAAALSKGALYWHFPGKDALYLDCLKRLHELFDSYIFDPMREAADPVAGLLLMFRGIENLTLDPRVENGIAGYWLVSSNAMSGEIFETQRAFERNSRDTVEKILRRAVEEKRFDLHGDLEAMARAIIFMIEAAMLPLRNMSADEMRDLLGVLARTLFRAYAPGMVLPSL